MTELNSVESTLSGVISTSEDTLSGVIDDSDTLVSGYIVASRDTVSGIIDDSDEQISGYIISARNTISGIIDESDTYISGYIEESMNAISGVIDTSTIFLSGVIDDSDTLISGYITTARDQISGYIVDTEGNIRGGDSDDLKSLSDQLDSLQQNTFVRLNVPETIYLPTLGTSDYQIDINIFDNEGNPEAPDEVPEITIVNADNVTMVDAVSMTLLDVGQYYYIYALAHDQPYGVTKVSVKIIEGAKTAWYRDYTLVSTIGDVSSIAYNVEAIKARTDNLPADTEDYLADIAGLMYNNSELTITAKSATGKLVSGYLTSYESGMVSERVTWYLTAEYDNADHLTSHKVIRGT